MPLINSIPWEYKPEDGREEQLDWTNPIIDSSLVGVFHPTNAGGFRNILTGETSTRTGTTITTLGYDDKFGTGRVTAAADDTREVFSDLRLRAPVAGRTSFAIWFRIPADEAGTSGLCGIWGSGASRQFRILSTNTTNQLHVQHFLNGLSVSQFFSGATELFGGGLIGIVVTYDRVTIETRIHYYDSSTADTTQSTAETGDYETGSDFTLCALDSGSTLGWIVDSPVFTVIKSNRAWPVEEVINLLESPFAIYKPRSTMVDTAAAETITVDKWHPGIQQPYPHVNQVIPY